MIRSLQHFALTAALAALAFVGAAPASAQVVFDDFNDGNVEGNVGAFAGNPNNDAGAGVGPIDGVGGAENTGLNLGINSGSGDAFAGTFITAPDGIFDASGQTYFTFFVRQTVPAGVPLTLEIALQEDINGDGQFDGNGGGPEDEIRTAYRLDGNASDYEFVQIPLASFIDSGAGANDGVDLSQVLNVVFVFGGLPGGLEFAVSFDELGFVSGMPDTSEETATSTLSGFALSAAYPNPFQSTATFTLEMDRSEAVRVEVFDVLGRQVAVLNDGVLSAQTHTFQIDARGLSSGLYLYRATGESFSATRRVVLQD